MERTKGAGLLLDAEVRGAGSVNAGTTPLLVRCRGSRAMQRRRAGAGDREQSEGVPRSWAWGRSDRPDPGRGEPVPGGGGAPQLARARGDEDPFQDEAAAGVHGDGVSGRERD